MTDLYRVTGQGLITLGPELVEVMDALDRQFLRWADECRAAQMTFPSVISTADLRSIDYFDNFPQLALMTAPLLVSEAGAGFSDDASVPATRLGDSEYGLVSAACYNVYLHHRTNRLTGTQRVTTVSRCFRNEDHYDGLRRLRGFTMREIVCLGSREAVLDHLADLRPKVLAFAEELGLTLRIEAASDPFFEKSGGRALLAQLFPVKEEFVHGGSLAIASMNFHRNFFGERCQISQPSGETAFTSCVAFGLERWLAALLETHAEIDVIHDRVTEAGR